MTTRHALPGDVIDVLPPGSDLSQVKTEAFFKADGLEVIRMVLPQGKHIPTHHTPGPITVQCLAGRIEFTAYGKPIELKAGQLIYLTPNEPHALLALETSAVLVTLRLQTEGNAD